MIFRSKQKHFNKYSITVTPVIYTAPLDQALAKAKELEDTINRARTLAGELTRLTRSLKLNVEVDCGSTDLASVASDTNDCI